MKGLRIADTQELCFEAWKRSHNACSAVLCGQFSDSQKSRFQASKRKICVVLSWKVVVRLIFPNSAFKLQKFQIWNVYNYMWFYLLKVRNGIFRSRKVQIIAVQSCNRVDLQMFTKVFSVCEM